MLRPRSEEGEQRPGVEKCGVIWVVLNADNVDLRVVRQLGKLIGQGQVLRRRVNVDTKKRRVLLSIRHLRTPGFYIPLSKMGDGCWQTSVGAD